MAYHVNKSDFFIIFYNDVYKIEAEKFINKNTGVSNYKLHISIPKEFFELHQESIKSILLNYLEKGTINIFKLIKMDMLRKETEKILLLLTMLTEADNFLLSSLEPSKEWLDKFLYIFNKMNHKHSCIESISSLRKKWTCTLAEAQRFFAGDQITVYIPLECNKKDILLLCEEINTYLHNNKVISGIYTDVESPLGSYINFRQEYLQRDFEEINNNDADGSRKMIYSVEINVDSSRIEQRKKIVLEQESSDLYCYLNAAINVKNDSRNEELIPRIFNFSKPIAQKEQMHVNVDSISLIKEYDRLFPNVTIDGKDIHHDYANYILEKTPYDSLEVFLKKIAHEDKALYFIRQKKDGHIVFFCEISRKKNGKMMVSLMQQNKDFDAVIPQMPIDMVMALLHEFVTYYGISEVYSKQYVSFDLKVLDNQTWQKILAHKNFPLLTNFILKNKGKTRLNDSYFKYHKLDISNLFSYFNFLIKQGEDLDWIKKNIMSFLSDTDTDIESLQLLEKNLAASFDFLEKLKQSQQTEERFSNFDWFNSGKDYWIENSVDFSLPVNGVTLIDAAINARQWNVVSFLIKDHLLIKNIENCTPIFFKIIEEGQWSFARMLIEQYRTQITIDNIFTMTILDAAVKANEWSIIRFLIEEDEQLKHPQSNKLIMQFVAETDDSQIVEFFIKNYQGIDEIIFNGAIKTKNWPIVQFLIEKQLKLTITTDSNRKALLDKAVEDKIILQFIINNYPGWIRYGHVTVKFMLSLAEAGQWGLLQSLIEKSVLHIKFNEWGIYTDIFNCAAKANQWDLLHCFLTKPMPETLCDVLLELAIIHDKGDMVRDVMRIFRPRVQPKPVQNDAYNCFESIHSRSQSDGFSAINKQVTHCVKTAVNAIDKLGAQSEKNNKLRKLLLKNITVYEKGYGIAINTLDEFVMALNVFEEENQLNRFSVNSFFSSPDLFLPLEKIIYALEVNLRRIDTDPPNKTCQLL